MRKDVAITLLLHHGNGPSLTSLRIHEFLAKIKLATLPQPPYIRGLVRISRPH